jgi:hypothetical protein
MIGESLARTIIIATRAAAKTRAGLVAPYRANADVPVNLAICLA